MGLYLFMSLPFCVLLLSLTPLILPLILLPAFEFYDLKESQCTYFDGTFRKRNGLI